jgi:hypothetical protein
MPRYSLYFQDAYGPNGIRLVAESDDFQKLVVMGEDGDWEIAAWIENADGNEVWVQEVVEDE